jgi:hypothetical protein
MNPIVVPGVVIFGVGYSDATMVDCNVTLLGSTGRQFLVLMPTAAATTLVIGSTVTLTFTSP